MLGSRAMSSLLLVRQADALEQAEQVEFALRLHLVEHLVGRKIVDADDHALAQRSKPFGRRSKTSCAMASISASEGLLLRFHIAPV